MDLSLVQRSVLSTELLLPQLLFIKKYIQSLHVLKWYNVINPSQRNKKVSHFAECLFSENTLLLQNWRPHHVKKLPKKHYSKSASFGIGFPTTVVPLCSFKEWKGNKIFDMPKIKHQSSLQAQKYRFNIPHMPRLHMSDKWKQAE
jgi:hypothetical protein